MCSHSCVTYNGKILNYILLLTLVLYNIEMMEILELLNAPSCMWFAVKS
jgi:hypothetical protein